MDSKQVRNPYNGLDDLQSDFGDLPDDDRIAQKKRKGDLMEKVRPDDLMKRKRTDGRADFQEEHGRMHRKMAKMMSMNAYERHKEMINLYYLSYPGATKLLNRKVEGETTDLDVLKKHHKFVWNEEDEGKEPESWEKRMAKKYYEKLYREFAIIDLSMYKNNKFGLRWRTENEVKEGKGHWWCGARKCSENSQMATWEVNFAYKEDGRSKNTLVKVTLCPKCSNKLNYGSKKRQIKQKKRAVRKWDKQRRREDSDEDEGVGTSEMKIEEQDKDQPSTSAAPTLSASTDIWEGPAPAETEKTVDDEIDEFLNDLFL
ncbi:unnamed protein product [Caenorhabditis nigoni]